MPTTTGLVLAALVRYGRGDGSIAERGAVYLVETQREDGTWRDGFVHGTGFPGIRLFYENLIYGHYYPLFGLGKYRRHRRSRSR